MQVGSAGANIYQQKCEYQPCHVANAKRGIFSSGAEVALIQLAYECGVSFISAADSRQTI
jgi:hypothetical protein